MVNRHETMADDHFEHGFAVDWMRKDLGICLSTADETGASLPVTALVDQFYKDVQKMGGGRWDTSSLIARLEDLQKQLEVAEDAQSDFETSTTTLQQAGLDRDAFLTIFLAQIENQPAGVCGRSRTWFIMTEGPETPRSFGLS